LWFAKSRGLKKYKQVEGKFLGKIYFGRRINNLSSHKEENYFMKKIFMLREPCNFEIVI